MKNKELSQRVTEEIKRREVKMRPRLYFVGGSILLGLGLAGAVITAVFFLNLFVFRLRVLGPMNCLRLTTFPWTVLLVSVVGIAAGLALLKRYEFSYKMNFLVFAIVLIIVVGALGFLLDRVGFNERMMRRRHMRPFYKHQIMPPNPRIKGRRLSMK